MYISFVQSYCYFSYVFSPFQRGIFIRHFIFGWPFFSPLLMETECAPILDLYKHTYLWVRNKRWNEQARNIFFIFSFFLCHKNDPPHAHTSDGDMRCFVKAQSKIRTTRRKEGEVQTKPKWAIQFFFGYVFLQSWYTEVTTKS